MYPSAISSQKGVEKTYNEDFVLQFEYGGALIILIADGMGAKTGEINPGKLACDEVAWYIQKRPFVTFSDLAEIVYMSFQHAHRILRSLRRFSQGESIATSLTLFAASKEQKECLMAHVGHTRCGLLQQGEWSWFTGDDTPAGQKLQQGLISEDEWLQDTERALLSKYLGGQGEEIPLQVLSGPLQAGDLFVLSSDGFHGFVTAQELAYLLEQTGDLSVACMEALDLAGERQGFDDKSLAMVAIT